MSHRTHQKAAETRSRRAFVDLTELLYLTWTNPTSSHPPRVSRKLFRLEHYLHTPYNFIELVLTKLWMRLAEV